MIILYSKNNCPYCVKAEQLLKGMNVEYKKLTLEIDYTRDELLALVDKYNGTIYPLTVPKIVDDDIKVYFDGYDDFELNYNKLFI